MRFPFRAIALGILIGAALFFFPFVFRFIFFALFVFLIIRLLVGARWHGRRWGRGYYARPYFGAHDDDYGDDIVPIDGRRHISAINRKTPEREFPIR